MPTFPHSQFSHMHMLFFCTQKERDNAYIHCSFRQTTQLIEYRYRERKFCCSTTPQSRCLSASVFEAEQQKGFGEFLFFFFTFFLLTVSYSFLLSINIFSVVVLLCSAQIDYTGNMHCLELQKIK